MTVTGATVNGVLVTNYAGNDFPFSSGALNVFTTSESGPFCTIVLSLSGYVSTERILLTDSNENQYSCTSFTGNGTYTFTNVAVNNTNPVYITGLDGEC
jgi:hypothetical protein